MIAIFEKQRVAERCSGVQTLKGGISETSIANVFDSSREFLESFDVIVCSQNRQGIGILLALSCYILTPCLKFAFLLTRVAKLNTTREGKGEKKSLYKGSLNAHDDDLLPAYGMNPQMFCKDFHATEKFHYSKIFRPFFFIKFALPQNFLFSSSGPAHKREASNTVTIVDIQLQFFYLPVWNSCSPFPTTLDWWWRWRVAFNTQISWSFNKPNTQDRNPLLNEFSIFCCTSVRTVF